MKIALTATPSQPRSAPFLLRGDIPGAFRTAAELGCQGVELHLLRAEDVNPGDVKRLMAEYNLEVPTLGTGMAAGVDGLTFSDPDPTVRARAVERVRGHLNLACELGSAVIIGLIRGKLGTTESTMRRRTVLECLGEVCRTAERLGVTVLLEPMNRYECDYINTLADGAAFAAEIGAANLKVLADTFHMNIEETGIEAALRDAGSRLGHVHLADSNRRAPGHGHLNIAGILRALAGMEYRGYLALEILPLPDPLQAIRDSIRTIQEQQA